MVNKIKTFYFNPCFICNCSINKCGNNFEYLTGFNGKKRFMQQHIVSQAIQTSPHHYTGCSV